MKTSITSLGLVGGLLAIGITLAITTPLGAQSFSTTTVDTGASPGTTGQYNSQVVIAGNPAVSYYDVSHGDLKFARNTAADGFGSWTVTTVDGIGIGNVGQYTSLAIIDGKPAISYYDVTNGDLKFALNSAADGSGAWTVTTVDSTGNVGQYTALAMVEGGNGSVFIF